MDDLLDMSWQPQANGNNHGSSSSSRAANIPTMISPPLKLNVPSPLAGKQNNPFSINNAPSRSSTPLNNVAGGGGGGGSSSSTNGTSSAYNTRSATPAADSFGGLVDFGKGSGSGKTGPMSMQQQAAANEAQRRSQAAALDRQFGNMSIHGVSRSGTPSVPSPAPAAGIPSLTSGREDSETAEDLMAQINGERPFTRGDSYYPPPASPTRTSILEPETKPQAHRNEQNASSASQNGNAAKSLDDEFVDMFAAARAHGKSRAVAAVDDDEDILGALGKPIDTSVDRGKRAVRPTDGADEINPPAKPARRPTAPTYDHDHDNSDDDDEDMRRAKEESLRTNAQTQQMHARREREEDRAVASIMEMGFTDMQARMALANTENGTDVRAALDLLLSLQGTPVDAPKRPSERTQKSRQEQAPQQRHTQSGRTSAEDDADWVDQTYVMASKTLASANTWFVNKSAMARRKLAEYNRSVATTPHIKDDRPKWMRETQQQEAKSKGKSRARFDDNDGDEVRGIREEGLPMHPAERKRLEANGVLPPSQQNQSPSLYGGSASGGGSRRNSVDSTKSGKSFTSMRSIPDSLRQFGAGWGASSAAAVTATAATLDARRFKADEDDTSQYVSSRRRRPQQQSTPPAPVEEEDLFGASSSSRASASGKGKARSAAPIEEDDLFGAPSGSGSGPSSSTAKGKGRESTFGSGRRASLPGATTRPKRRIPHVDASILTTSTQFRQRGSEAFKRGDFTAALAAYDRSLQGLPDDHPLKAVSLTNRALVRIQTGSAREAVEDAQAAISLIGVGRGEGETVSAGTRVDDKPIALNTIWAKAMQRKATALEMQERHSDALPVWQELVRSGLGGPSAIESRTRCENALKPKSKPAPQPTRPVSAPVESRAAAAAVRKLRAEAAATADEETQRVALYDTVAGKLDAWSKGKETNLRALLASMDLVLWPSANWKSVTLADLVVPAKCKVVYMRALAKVHPDKIHREASVQEKMLAAAVFAKLNAAWDVFKSQNNM
ncbi:auxilin-like clathrin-binding protein required for normal clathrin function [Savitreella phatthalungensis]